MKNVLVFGGTGMAGHMITLYLSQFKEKYNVCNICYKNKLDEKSIICDVSNLSEVNEVINSANPDVIINCIGILNKTADKDVKNTVYINTFFPRFLARIGVIKNILIIHISTDCVFDGKDGDYTEFSFKSENSLYGLSKNLGEIYDENSLTIRTSIIGPELKNGSGLFHWFMNQSGTIVGFNKTYWTGITTLELAKAVDEAINTRLCGLYHVVPNRKISKYDLLNIFKNEFNKDEIILEKNETSISDKSLISKKEGFNYIVSSYEGMISEMKIWMLNHKYLYKSYFK